ncbi:hypothetical protein Taro_000016, partial [Colocasia esculenta]|nr:hypothetical protein [Colocasia esculenta]
WFPLCGFSWGAWCTHPTAGSVTRSLVLFVVAPECVVPCPRSVSMVQGGSACGPSTLWRSEVAVPVLLRCSMSSFVSAGMCRGFASALCCSGPTPVAGGGVALVVFAYVDSTGSAGVMFGLTRVVVEAFLALLLCRVVLLPILLKFLLLWLVFGSVGGGASFGGPWRGSGRSSRYN